MEEKSLVPGQKETIQPSDDYYTPLFIQNFTGATNWMQPIEKILFHANKTIATPDAYLAIQDHQACKVLRRVYHLQQHDKWSLRQPKRCLEPTRPPSHWDVLFQEMKWMRTDFREERKWKMAVAKNIAYACADWVESSPEERKTLQVAAFIPPLRTDDVTMADADAEDAENHPTPDLITEDADSPQILDNLSEDFPETVAPSAIFALQGDDVVFALRQSPASDKLLEELPLYGAPLRTPRLELTGPEYDPDAHWRRPALPLSKYVEGEMKLLSDGPPRKRSRYSYYNEESDDEKETAFDADTLAHNVRLPPRSTEVALFTPDSKHIRDRLHAGHQFRPPSEHPMPLQSFYETRSSSQWTVVEDDELRNLVREHSYNWSLISNLLSTRSLFASGAERRTPWECFERWINLEGLPADMQKTQYFKAYNSRIDAAQRIIAQQNQLAAQRASQDGGAVTPIRRRQSTPLRVERRRNQKHLTLIDAMRKLAKKRETTIQKQQHSAAQNAAKKVNDTMAQRPGKTPRDYSIMRWERDQALAEKMAQFAQRQEAQRRVSKHSLYCDTVIAVRFNTSRLGYSPGQSPSSVRPAGCDTRCSRTGWPKSRPSRGGCQRRQRRHQSTRSSQSTCYYRCNCRIGAGSRSYAHAGSCQRHGRCRRSSADEQQSRSTCANERHPTGPVASFAGNASPTQNADARPATRR
jgi:chromatin modification-related protein VID21